MLPDLLRKMRIDLQPQGVLAEEPYPISPDVFLVSPDMKAVRVVTSDREGFDLAEHAWRDLLRALGTELGEAS